uniref:transposase n=1 Tax=Clostridium sp. 12(A) TaxID=1163671 RepID=UPI0009DDE5F0
MLIYAYSQGVYYSRKIKTACKRDIKILWLLEGDKAPDHNTIARFRTLFLKEACTVLLG